jgi:hypothetical protein
VHVVAAGVHHRGVFAARVGRDHVAGVVEPSLLPHRQRVHVGAQQHHRAVAVAQHARDTGAADTGEHGEPSRVQPLCGDRRRPVLGERQLRVRMEILVQRDEITHYSRPIFRSSTLRLFYLSR